MIIGLVGMYASGKDSVAEHLADRGFTHFSLSDMLREELRRRGLDITRENLIEVGNELRSTYGHGVLGKKALENITANKGDFVISSIRHPAEAKELMTHGHFFLVEVRAPIKTRFKRLKKRNREEDPTTLADLKENEKLESQKEGPGQQLTNTLKLAKYVLTNDSTLKRLQDKTDKLVADLQKIAETLSVYVRPSWDDYFMGLVTEIGKRGTCDRGRPGCVIVKNKRIMTTGYAGSPVGIKHCDDIGHEIKQTIHEDGRISKHCVRTTHAEQNAICQAARYGISIDDSTVYCKMEPCYICAKMIINAGVKRVVCAMRYHGSKESRRIFKESGVDLVVLSEELLTYKSM